jgi:hypothetical protein
MSRMAIDVETAASQAKRLKSGDNEKESRTIDELIKADQYVQNNSAVAGTSRRGLLITKLRPPGSI